MPGGEHEAQGHKEGFFLCDFGFEGKNISHVFPLASSCSKAELLCLFLEMWWKCGLVVFGFK
jgi:hypothetical protein